MTEKLFADASLVLLPTTSTYFEGAGPEELASFGFSRDKRGNRPQSHLALLTSRMAPSIPYLERMMTLIGLEDRWVFRHPELGTDETVGALDTQGLLRLYAEADAVLNVCGSHRVRDEHRAGARFVYLETDPVAKQVQVAQGDARVINELRQHDYFFTYGQSLCTNESPIPNSGFDWRRTRPPVVTDWWRPGAPLRPDAPLTTVANWNTSGTDVTWGGETWTWNKRTNFLRFIDAPARLPYDLEIAVVNAGDDRAVLLAHNWRVMSGMAILDPGDYRDYIVGSRGEFSVAKAHYVAPRSGWFSDRTVCYLAAGRPAMLQDTAFGDWVPTGEGLFAFATPEDVSAAGEALASDYERHARRAAELARDTFEAEVVMDEVMRSIGLT